VKLVTLTKGEKLQAIARVMPDDESAETENQEEAESETDGDTEEK
jgi:hypothetical protein